jgi:uncharacterized OB-fold protein
MSLLERNPQPSPAWRGNLPIRSRYSAGLAGEKFFRVLKEEGTILGSRCDSCDLTYVPGRQFCERCLDELTEWTDMGIQGDIHSFTLLYLDLDGSVREEPEIIAFIRFGDGGIIHRIADVNVETLEIGTTVEAVLKEKAEREGSILDIQHFKPVE